MNLIIVVFCILFPALLLLGRERYIIFSKLNPLITCYAVGLIIGNAGILGEGSAVLLDMVSTVAVALSIPLLLFSVDMRKWRELTGKTGLAFVLACVSVIIVSTVAYFLFRNRIDDSAKVAGMLVGVYTGGTPNLAAIKTALNVNMNSYLAVHSSDIIISAVYYLFVLTAARKVLGLILPAYKRNIATQETDAADGKNALENIGTTRLFSDLFQKGIRLPLLGALGIAVLILGIGFGVSLLVPATWQTMAAILSFTTLAIVAALFPKVRGIKGTFTAGEYILYVFCVSVGAMGDFRVFIGSAPAYFLFVLVVLFGSFILHAVLCSIFRVDTDTMLVVSVSAINSPPFVGRFVLL